jgi:membrane protein YqaA with SNARE-associated domain
LYSAQLSRVGTLDGTGFISNSFLCNAPEAGLIGAVFLFKFRRIKYLIVAAITELVVRRALPFNERI